MPPETVQNWAVWLAAVVAGLGALGWLGKKTWVGIRWLRRFARKADALLDIADYELNPNGGGSIKDRIARIPGLEQGLDEHLEQSRQRDEAQRKRDAQTLALLDEHTRAITHLAEALPIVARSTPDPTDTEV